MGTRWLAALLATVGLLGPGEPASAKGSWFEPENLYQAAGNRVSLRTIFGSGAYEGRVSDGPYFAYLVPGFRWFERPGSVPDYALPLGPITIRPATGNFCCWVAALIFTVPDVKPGRYSITYCNDPCTVDGLGDFDGGTFWIAETREDAALLSRLDRLEHQADRLRDVRAELRRVEARPEAARVRYDQLVGGLRAARPDDEPSAIETTEPAARPVPSWAVVAGVAVLGAGVWFRRRLGRTTIPDFVPKELVRGAQVPSRQPMTSSGRPAMSMPAPPRTKS